MTQSANLQVQEWVHPGSGQKVTLRFDGQKTTLERGGKVTVIQQKPFDEAAVKAQFESNQSSLFEWNVIGISQWQQLLIGTYPTPEEAKKQFLEMGFPDKLWDDIRDFQQKVGLPLRENAGNSAAQASAGIFAVVGPGEAAPVDIPGMVTIHLDDPYFKDSLLFHPTPEIMKRFNEWNQPAPVTITAPPASAVFTEQAQALRQQGFLRLTARHPDGSLWLPPALEPHRKALQASEKPVVRLGADVGRTPKLWESKVGGVPYRLKGSAWPMSTEKTPRPLVFLAQINFAEVNVGGKNLPDFPSSGLLQFFILNTEMYGADTMFSPQGGVADLSGPADKYRVVYLPEVIQDEVRLETTAPRPLYDSDEVEKLKKDGFASLIDDGYLIIDRLPYDDDYLRKLPQVKWPFPAIALNAVADREIVSGADHLNLSLLNLPTDYWNNEQAGAVVSALYETSPEGHKLGGYPNFTQSDPRRNPQEWVLLFQLDSDPALNLMWGDVGTANFFIRPEDLQKRDFSKVAYHWDCG